jgi:hypothetical protein
MPQIFGSGLSGPGYNLTDLIAGAQPTPPSKGPGLFRRILGTAVGLAGNMFAPGIGSAIGSLISGGGSASGLVGRDNPAQYLQLQQQILAESRSYEAVSNVLKAKHDSAMAAIRNLH